MRVIERIVDTVTGRKKRAFREWIRRLRFAAPPDNRGIGYVEIVLITVVIALVVMVLFPKIARADTRECEEMYLTCYCPESCPGTITYTGATVREGIAATHPDHIGDVAVIFTTEGRYLGRWECLDKLGTGKRSVIDVWQPDLDSAKELMTQTKGRVRVFWIERAER